MNADLRDSLHHLAEASTAPDPARSAALAWTGGRRLRRRDRAVTAVLGLGLVASLGGLAALALDPPGVPPALTPADQVDGRGAVPMSIEPYPDLSTSVALDVGRASVAYVSPDDQPVVVRARDGRAVPLDLPGWTAAAPLALSPDGTRLLWVQVLDSSPGQQVSVLDLPTGQVEDVDTPPDADEAINHLSWSPDSRRVAWVAQELDGSSVRSVRLGEVARGARWLLPERATSVAVGNRGDLVVGVDGALLTTDARQRFTRTVPTNAPARAGAASPSGAYVALASEASAATYTLDIAAAEVVDHPFPADTFTTATSRPLGWIDDRTQVLLVQPGPGESAELVITTPQVDEDSTWRRRAGVVAPELVESLSVAVDLMPALDGTSSQKFTHDFTPAGGPASAVALGPFLVLGLLVALALAALLLVVRRQRAVR